MSQTAKHNIHNYLFNFPINIFKRWVQDYYTHFMAEKDEAQNFVVVVVVGGGSGFRQNLIFSVLLLQALE